jgi:hypothetical protein
MSKYPRDVQRRLVCELLPLMEGMALRIADERAKYDADGR